MALLAGVSREEVASILAPPQAANELGCLGAFRVLKMLGRGGMGMVFLAWDTELNRNVALKVMLPIIAEDPEAKKRFLREARSAAAIKHKHIVTIYQVGGADCVPFLAMEFLEGESLEERLKRGGEDNSPFASHTIAGKATGKGRPLPTVEVLRIGREIADGLAAAHAHGLIHRDIKPLNIWLETIPAGGASKSFHCVKILDFGLARGVGNETQLTREGEFVGGTMAYMSPEQEAGEPVDHRGDLYSLGCTLYRMCSGHLPPPLASRPAQPPVELNPDVPPLLSDLVLELLAKNPADRPQSAAEVRERLSKIGDAAGKPADWLQERGQRKGLWGVLAGAVGFTLILVLVVLAYAPWRGEPEPIGITRKETPEEKKAEDDKKPTVIPRKPIPSSDPDYVPKKILAHVQAQKSASVPYVRFFSNHHLKVAGADEADIELHRKALVFAIKAMSRTDNVIDLKPVGDAIYAVDIRTLGWDEKPFTHGEEKKPADVNLFDLILLEYPYGIRPQKSQTFDDVWIEFLKPAGQVKPIAWVRGDWLVDAVHSLPVLREPPLQGKAKVRDLDEIKQVSERFQKKSLDVKSASAELGVPEEVLRKHLPSLVAEAPKLAPLLTEDGIIARDTWTHSFNLLVAKLDLGTPVPPLDGLMLRDFQSTPGIDLELKTNKSDNVFTVGDESVIVVKNQSKTAIFIELIGTRGDGSKVIVPHLPRGRDTPLQPGETYRIPSEGPGNPVGEDIGKERLTLIASDQKFPVGDLLDGQGIVADRVLYSFQNSSRVVKKTIDIETRAARIEREFYRLAPEIIETLKKQGFKNVGVLKFLVRKGDDKPTPIAGTLNLDLANRLAIALVLRNHEESPLGILRDANAVAARLTGASHLTAEGRRKLFDATYPLAWGDEKVAPDAFLSGLARLSTDLSKMTVELWLVDKQRGLVKDAFKPIEASTAPGNLTEAGESFLLRDWSERQKAGKANQESISPISPASAAREVQQGKTNHPFADAAKAPVELEIRYDGQKVPLNIENGRATIEEPMQNQEVVFVVKRQGDPPARYKIVLKVNGINSIEKERRPDLQCWGWVLDREMNTLEIKGFQMGQDIVEVFKVVSPEESRKKEVDYGQDVGTITVTVFAESQTKEKPQVFFALDAEKNTGAEVISAGVFPDSKKQGKQELAENSIKTIDVLQTQLRTQYITRGLIEGGNRIPSQVETVPFPVDPTPIMSAVITYYRRPTP